MEIERAKTVAFSGHRNLSYVNHKQLYTRTLEQIKILYDEGFRNFISGLAVGFDLLAATAVLEFQEDHPDVQLIGAVPFMGQELRYTEAQKELYVEVSERCNVIRLLSDCYHSRAYHERNEFMVNNCAVLVCFYDGTPSGTGYTVNYARCSGARVINTYI